VKELLFSVTASDCDWSYTRGTGKGGQKRNKTSSAVHCTHRASGAHGYAEDSRGQRSNRESAFRRMAGTSEFKTWHKREVSRLLGNDAEVERRVAYEMEHNLRVDVVVDGKWRLEE